MRMRQSDGHRADDHARSNRQPDGIDDRTRMQFDRIGVPALVLNAKTVGSVEADDSAVNVLILGILLDGIGWDVLRLRGDRKCQADCGDRGESDFVHSARETLPHAA